MDIVRGCNDGDTASTSRISQSSLSDTENSPEKDAEYDCDDTAGNRTTIH